MPEVVLVPQNHPHRAAVSRIASEAGLAIREQPESGAAPAMALVLDGSDDPARFEGQARSLLVTLERPADAALAPFFRHASPVHLTAITSDALTRSLAQLRSGEGMRATEAVPAGVLRQDFRVRRSADRHKVVSALGLLTASVGGAPHCAELVQTLADELLTNALYNAPVGPDARPLFAHLPRATEVELGPQEAIELVFIASAERVALEVTDRFGSLSLRRIHEVFERCLRSNEVENKRGGAGLGLFTCYLGANHLVISLQPGRSTRVLAVLDTRASRREQAQLPRSFSCLVKER